MNYYDVELTVMAINHSIQIGSALIQYVAEYCARLSSTVQIIVESRPTVSSKIWKYYNAVVLG